MQFGFMKGRGTTDAIFIVGQMREKFGAKGGGSFFASGCNNLSNSALVIVLTSI